MTTKSTYLIKFFNFTAILFAAPLLTTSCAQDLAEKTYVSSVAGYESKVQKQQISSASAAPSSYTTQSNNVPVIVNNPYSFSNVMPQIQQGGYQQPLPVAYAPAAGNPAYGSLGSSEGNVINQNVFMQGGAVIPQTTYGGNYYSPVGR